MRSCVRAEAPPRGSPRAGQQGPRPGDPSIRDPGRHRGRGQDRHRDRGLAESVSWTLVAPTLLLAVLALVYGAAWLHGRTVVQQAALTAAEVQSLNGAAPGAGDQAARRLTAGLQDVSILVRSDARSVIASVSGRVPMPIDVGLGQVTATAIRPIEG